MRDYRDIFPPLRPPRPEPPFYWLARERWEALERRIDQARQLFVRPARRWLRLQVAYHTEPLRLWYRGEILSGRPPVADLLIAIREGRTRREVADAVQGEGFAVVTTDSPSALLGHLQITKFRGAVIDLELRRFRGWPMIRWIRERFPTLKLIVVGPRDPANIHRAMRLGAFSYLDKPIDPSKLLTCIRNVLYTRIEVCPVERLGMPCDRSCVPEGTDIQRFGQGYEELR